MAAINPKVFLYRFPSKITSGIATLSYAVYLIHKIVVHVSQKQLSKLDIPKESVLMFVLCVLTSITGAWLLNRLVEKPFLKLRDKMLKTEKHRVFQVE